jgi:ribosomal protein S27AE
MAATSSSSKKFEDLIEKFKQDYPQFKFKPGRQAHWSPASRTIIYNQTDSFTRQAPALLHELAHATLGHSDYKSDFELLKLEAEAWHEAAVLGKKYGIGINEDYIQNCLDTYRDWLHRRSACPACGTHVLQTNDDRYQCYNCQTVWHVTTARFLRPYRKTVKNKKLA